MKIGIQSLYDVFNKQNNIFNEELYPIGENLQYPFVLLRDQFRNQGYSLDTLDIYPIQEYRKIIFLDYPNLSKNELQKFVHFKIDLYLVLLESELIHPKNFDKNNHALFQKIFTWADDLIDNKKYFKLNLCNKIPVDFHIDIENKNKFCTNISGNKTSRKPNELYSKRVKAIEWFEKNHPKQFDLYGFDWDYYTFANPFGKLNKFPFLRKFFGKKYSVYKGSIKNKIETLAMYKFSICYENIKSNNGYISEKIFDCFFAGTIPIYLGEENIHTLIPTSVYIDKRNFKTYDDLYIYINTLNLDEYRCYLSAIENFVKGRDIYPFSAECFAKVISQNIDLIDKPKVSIKDVM